jgi:hypothetical protein
MWQAFHGWAGVCSRGCIEPSSRPDYHRTKWRAASLCFFLPRFLWGPTESEGAFRQKPVRHIKQLASMAFP